MTMNVPYKKQYKNGVHINPIKGFYPGRKYLFTDNEGKPHFAPNRSQRRSKSPSLNNRKMARSRSNRQIIKGIVKRFFKTILHGVNIKATRFPKRK